MTFKELKIQLESHGVDSGYVLTFDWEEAVLKTRSKAIKSLTLYLIEEYLAVVEVVEAAGETIELLEGDLLEANIDATQEGKE